VSIASSHLVSINDSHHWFDVAPPRPDHLVINLPGRPLSATAPNFGEALIPFIRHLGAGAALAAIGAIPGKSR
jgi:hypothetical protein